LEQSGEEWVDPINGSDLILSIDYTIQSIAEKYLEKACIDNKVTDGGNVIMMDPKTGDILAMASYPNYNPQDFINGISEEKWQEYQEKTALLNRAIQSSYAPRFNF